MAKNVEKVRAYNREYYIKNKAKLDHIGLVYARSIPGRFTDTKAQAKVRGIVFDITLEQFDLFYKSACFVSGCTDKVTGVDRMDNCQGYIISNVRPSCKRHNQMRNNMTDEEFIKKCREVVNWADSLKGQN